MQISHFSSGALVGAMSPNPIVALAGGVAAHFVIDKIPHYWPASSRAKWLFTIADYAVALLLLGFILSTSSADRMNMLLGFLGSAVVDVALVGLPFIRKTKIGKWHTNRQPHRTDPVTLLTDVVLSTACVALLVAI